MIDTLKYVVSSIVEHADEVAVSEEKADEITNLIIKVHNDDIGKVIGKGGKVIRSIRNIMKIKAIKHDERINISIADSENK